MSIPIKSISLEQKPRAKGVSVELVRHRDGVFAVTHRQALAKKRNVLVLHVYRSFEFVQGSRGAIERESTHR